MKKRVRRQKQRAVLNSASKIINDDFVKKGLLVVFSSLIVAFIALSFTQPTALSAAPADVTAGIETGKTWVAAVFNPILDPLMGDTELLTRVFFAVLLFMILYSIIRAVFKKGRAFTVILTVIITALALVALPANFITAIRTQYGVMGAAILSIIPFVIMLIFTVRLGSKLAGRMLWIFYAIYYFALFGYGWVKTGSWFNAEAIPYIASVVGGLIMIIFIGPIRDAIFKGELSDIRESGIRTIEEEALLGELKTKELRKVYGKREEKA